MDRLPTSVFLDFPGGSAGKESTCNEGYLALIPGLGRSPGEEEGYPLQYSCLENSMDCIVLGVSKTQTQLTTFTLTFTFIVKIIHIFTRKQRSIGILCILIITSTEFIPTCNYIFTDLVPFYCLFPALDSKFYVSRDHVDFKHLSTLRVWHISVK